MKTGWISLHRKVKDNWLWKDKPFSFGQAWITVLLECNHSEKKVNLGNHLYHVKRGESINSLDTWSKLFGWNKSKVRRFFELLKSDSMIETKPTHNTTHLKVINYGSYQDIEHKDETNLKQTRHEVDTKVTPNNNDNNGNNGNNGRRFAKPTYNDISIYMSNEKIKNRIDVNDAMIEAEKFMNHYDSNGWRVGKNPMKDWKASVRNWLLNRKAENPQDFDWSKLK